MAEHLVATTRGRDRSLVEAQRGAWLWEHLRLALVCVFSCVLMPDHLHLVVGPGQSRRLRRVLNGFTCRFGVRFDVLEPEPANSFAIAGRQMRYGFFNPVRSGLVDDPWRWTFSTLRDLGGAAYPVWTPLPEVSARLDLPPDRALRGLTVTADTRPPALATELPAVATMSAVQAALTSALRFDPRVRLDHPLGRALTIQTLLELGVPSGHGLAQRVGCSTATVRRHRSRRHPAVGAVLRCCLADPRLHTSVR